jgi:hypothetical protein
MTPIKTETAGYCYLVCDQARGSLATTQEQLLYPALSAFIRVIRVKRTSLHYRDAGGATERGTLR